MLIEAGKPYYIETVTKYWTGIVVSIDGPNTVTIKDCAWVCCTGRFGTFFETGGLVRGERIANLEVEVMPDWVVQQVTFVSISDWPHPLFRKTIP